MKKIRKKKTSKKKYDQIPEVKAYFNFHFSHQCVVTSFDESSTIVVEWRHLQSIGHSN